MRSQSIAINDTTRNDIVAACEAVYADMVDFGGPEDESRDASSDYFDPIGFPCLPGVGRQPTIPSHPSGKLWRHAPKVFRLRKLCEERTSARVDVPHRGI